MKWPSIVSYGLLAGVVLSASGAQAQTPGPDCVPVVYAFRHAEDDKNPVSPFPCPSKPDLNCTTALTTAGKAHANLYVEMIASLESQENFCPVRKIYAVNPVNSETAGGTTNPFFTGKPLSNVVANRDPIIEIGSTRIDQKLTNAGVAAGLLQALVDNAKRNTSSALFWTSEGLHDLGVVLGTNIIPVKDAPEPFPGGPPRNAAYIFSYDSVSEAFDPPTGESAYVQCFNYTDGGENNFKNRFYCGKKDNGNLNDKLNSDQNKSKLYKLHARICSPLATDFVTKLDKDDFADRMVTGHGSYFGYCVSPRSASAARTSRRR
jgi:hypothetical protein